MALQTTTAKLPVISRRTISVGNAQPDPDLTNILRARAGDPLAKTCLWERYWRSLFSYFVRNRSLREEAEDLASDTLFDAFANLDSFRGTMSLWPAATDPPTLSDTRNVENRKCSFKTYLYSIARYKLYNDVRHKTIVRRVESSDMIPAGSRLEPLAQLELLLPLDMESDPLLGMIRKDRMDEVCCALAEVGLSSVEQFKVLLLHYFCDLSHREISELLATPQKTINSRLQTGREHMLKFYQVEPEITQI